MQRLSRATVVLGWIGLILVAAGTAVIADKVIEERGGSHSRYICRNNYLSWILLCVFGAGAQVLGTLVFFFGFNKGLVPQLWVVCALCALAASGGVLQLAANQSTSVSTCAFPAHALSSHAVDGARVALGGSIVVMGSYLAMLWAHTKVLVV